MIDDPYEGLTPHTEQYNASDDMPPDEHDDEPMITEQQRRALFGPIVQEYAKKHDLTIQEANVWLKHALIERGMIKESRSELTKENASKVIDGMLKALELELDSPWNI